MTAWQLPLPFPKGEGLGVGFGVNSQCTMHNDCLAASPPLFPKVRGNAESLNSYNYKL